MEPYGINVRTYVSLGLQNILRVALYRLGVKTGLNPVRRLRAVLPRGPFFRPVSAFVPFQPSLAWHETALYFGWYEVPLEGSPNWHKNPFTGKRVEKAQNPWWEVPDFDPRVGDIKTVWEASRFDWVLAMAQRAATGDGNELERLNNWLADWCAKNPAYCGPNWKCGQEASIRIMHLAMAALILDQIETAEPALLELVLVHLKRILPTLSYAIAQNNNHGTSEAAGLFIGGHWLALRGKNDKITKKSMAWGRKLLEDRIRCLIEPDGSFSQYSVTYQRVVLDTLCMVESWRKRLRLPRFSNHFYERCRAATDWLYAFVQPDTGDAPNIGSNDGARLIPLVDTDYRDFRPTVQLASALFHQSRAYKAFGKYDIPLKWLKIEDPFNLLPPAKSKLFDNGGYAFLQNGEASVYLRYPRFRFRPSHADALHLDLWIGGENILRDGGSYSYSAEDEWLNYFQGTASHNTIQFDGRDQMPRLSRFLFGDWLTTKDVRLIEELDNIVTLSASYTDKWGASHLRVVKLSNRSLRVTDEIKGNFKTAILRWRLMPDQWQIEGERVTNGKIILKVKASNPVGIRMVEGWESRYYLKKNRLPVLEITFSQPDKIITEINW